MLMPAAPIMIEKRISYNAASLSFLLSNDPTQLNVNDRSYSLSSEFRKTRQSLARCRRDLVSHKRRRIYAYSTPFLLADR